MNILFILDPLKKLDWQWDNSLFLLTELCRRGNQTWIADIPDLNARNGKVFAKASGVKPSPFPKKRFEPMDQFKFTCSQPQVFELTRKFDLILIRKEPPFNEAYLYMTHLLDLAAEKIPVLNHPRAIRDNNEKLSTLKFPKWIPKTIVTSSTKEIFNFQKKLGKDIVIKRLDEKGGKGIYRVSNAEAIHEWPLRNKKIFLAQEFLKNNFNPGEKRIFILNGRFLTAYEKRPPANDFRANLSLDGTFHPTVLTKKEKKLVAEVGPYLKKEGLHFAGIDVLNEKLLEINVTCPAGIREASVLTPKLRPVESWANALEFFVLASAAKRNRRAV